MPKLLTRARFSQDVLARDNGRCVFCKQAATEVHHVIERRLFDDGGYYLDNGVAVCNPCHIACEQTVISVEDARKAGGIKRVVLPAGMEPDLRYDKWGNQVLDDGRRCPGPIFHDAGVQQALRRGGFLGLFVEAA